jgi:pimeloyl-ACP methyl ester carboxylesterase
MNSLLKPSLFLLLWTTTMLSAADFPGKESQWKGYALNQFSLEGVGCKVVNPKKVAVGKPWIWRARFWGHEPQTDLALLEKGWHVVYCEVGNLFGSPKAVARWDAFYDYLVKEHGFAKKVALEGMSRGGLIIYNWAKANPEKVSCIYGDAPVCDFKSWPGGKGKGKGSAGTWKNCLKAYGLTEKEAMDFKGNPIDGLEVLAKAKVPLFHVIGEADTVVPVAENSDVIENRYEELGGSIEVIRKPGIGHHPHSLKDPKPIVDFVLRSSKQ